MLGRTQVKNEMFKDKCPHFEYCITPQYWGEKEKRSENYVETVCKTHQHLCCLHKDSLDIHFSNMGELEKEKAIERMKNYLAMLRGDA